MDIYGMSSAGQDFLGVDELFDFSDDRDDLFSYSTTTAGATDIFHNITSSTASATPFQYIFNNNNNNTTTTNYHHSTDFTDHFCVPNDDVAELEWLSKFVDDSSSNFPANNIAGTINFRPENTSIHSRSRSKRTRAPSNSNSWTSTPVPTTQISETSKTTKRETYSSTTSSSCDTTSEAAGVVRRCTHCASEKTPQWRTGPLGPKTLCNACGVRYKSGRLVPEYRPAASPTFVLTQHSNSHRKVMELRRQKEMILGHHHHQQQQLPPSEHQLYGGGHHHHRQQQQQLHHGSNYEVC